MGRPGPVRTETARLLEPGCAAGAWLLSSNMVKWGSPKEMAHSSHWGCTQEPAAGLPMKRSSTQCLPVTPPAAPMGMQTGSLALWWQEHHETSVTCISATTAGCPKILQLCGLPAGGVPQPTMTLLPTAGPALPASAPH